MMHCSASDHLIGAAPVWASVIILLVIGFVVGCITGFLTAWNRHQTMTRHVAPEVQNDVEQGNHAAARGWLPGVLRLKRRANIYIPDSPLASGPLIASLSGNEDNTPHALLQETAQSPATYSQASPMPQTAPAALTHGTADGHIPLDAILGTQTSLVRTDSGIRAYAGSRLEEESQTPEARPQATEQVESQAAKAARKARDVRAVGQAYEMDELDDAWMELLSQIDDKLLAMNKETLTSEERAIAIRTLLVSTAGEEPEVAMQHAIDAVERIRRFKRR